MKSVKKSPLPALPYFDALRIGNPLYDSLSRVTFHGTTQDAWATWSRGIFREILSPALHQGMQFAIAGHVRELGGMNEQISESLPASIRKTSLTCGRRLLLALTIPAGEKTLTKLRRQVEEQGCHFVVAYAARCAAFHFSPLLCVASYLCQEARKAFSSLAEPEFTEYIAFALQEGGAQEGCPLFHSKFSVPRSAEAVAQFPRTQTGGAKKQSLRP